MTRTRHRGAALVAALLITLGTSGCGGGAEESAADDVAVEGSAGPEQAAEPSDPVAVLEKVEGCNLEPGVEVGDVDMNGNRYATCTYDDNGSAPSGTSVTVRTYGADPREVADPADLQGDDSHKKIVGGDWVLTITGDWASYSADIDPEAVAQQVGGEYVSP